MMRTYSKGIKFSISGFKDSTCELELTLCWSLKDEELSDECGRSTTVNKGMPMEINITL